MLFVQIYIFEGCMFEQKKVVIEKVIQVLYEVIDVKKEIICVWIYEMFKENWGIVGVSVKDFGC